MYVNGTLKMSQIGSLIYGITHVHVLNGKSIVFVSAWTNVRGDTCIHCTCSDPNSVHCISVRPLKFWLTFFKLLLFEQVRFNYNQTWIIGALWEPSHYDAFGGHMTRSKVIWGQIVLVISVNLFQIVIVISVNLFQIAPVRTGSLQLQPNLVHTL